ncbi:hypothetical protein E2C01_094118 [Portunus trituberculatus]|uniref:Uncharacterized protein n=1 Tax=Portunus trituberculatus TaxID=210409 RepID=A0A5B7JWR5_PORTR|nr:hypothetical protein [Portunus trituberculatus]
MYQANTPTSQERVDQAITYREHVNNAITVSGHLCRLVSTVPEKPSRKLASIPGSLFAAPPPSGLDVTLNEKYTVYNFVFA